MVAPTKRPAALRLINGRSPGRDSGGRVVEPPPTFIREAPEPPEWLIGEALAEWQRIVPGLESLDLLKPEDRAALAVLCETWARWVEAVALYRAEGMVLTNPDSGRRHVHPAVSIANTAAQQLLR
jgi:P27 family predicted phage terminase small subunit